MNYSKLILCVLWCLPNIATALEKIPTLFVDTDGKDEHHYRNLMLMANSVGFTPQYKNLYDLLENPETEPFKAVFFIISSDVIKHLSSDLAQQIVQLINRTITSGNKIVGILLPSIMQSGKAQELTHLLLQQSNVLQLAPNNINAQKRSMIITTFLKFIGHHDALKGKLWGSTLINQGPVTLPRMMNTNGIEFTKWITNGTIAAAMLPMNRSKFTPLVAQSLPAGVFLRDFTLKNYYFIAKTSEFTFADIDENFFKNPIDLELRTQLLKVAQTMLYELHYAATKNKFLTMPNNCPELPKQLITKTLQKQTQEAIKDANAHMDPAHYRWIKSDGLSVAWLDPDDVNGKNYPKPVTELQQRGIQFIYDARFNLLWFEYNPEWYLSVNALRKEQKEQFINETRAFMTALQQKFNTEGKPLPRIFVGTDITSNFRTAPVNNPVQDVWGNDFSKIPSIFDFEHFWKPEVLDVFDLFCQGVGDTFPIDGIFFDFEMYHAQNQASGYNDLMDFSDVAWNIFARAAGNNGLTGIMDIKARVDYLKENKLFKNYFTILQLQARAIGQKIKEHLRSKVPNILIGAYAANASPGRLYRGLLAGLSSVQEPVIFATFNTDYYSHDEWLKAQGVYALHGTALLLSKFNTKKDFKLIPELLKYHYFVWYNRPSRMALDLDAATNAQQWWASEASVMPIQELAEGLAQH